MKKIKYDDFKEYDYITLYVRAEKVEIVERCYEKFLWKVVKKENNNKFNDIVDITFKRKHKIENKERLQLLQIYMEDNLNRTDKYEQNKFAKSTILGLTMGLLFLLFIGLGIWLIHGFPSLFTTILGIASIVFSIVIQVFIIILLPHFINLEREKFLNNINSLKKELENYLLEASTLSGEQNEKV